MSIRLLDLHWWEYLFIVLGFFMTCLFLNYLVKRLNEAKLDERFARLCHKGSTSQSTQVQGGLIEMENNSGRNFIPQNNPENPSPKGISLVFNQEQNKRRRDLDETYNIIKNTVDFRKVDVLSLNTNTPHESLESSSHKRSDCNLNEINTEIENDSGRIVTQTSFKEVSLKETHQLNQVSTTAIKATEKNEENFESRSFMIKTVNSLVLKIAGSLDTTDDSQNHQNSLTGTGSGTCIPKTVNTHMLKTAESSITDDDLQGQPLGDSSRSLIAKEDKNLLKSTELSNTNDFSNSHQKKSVDYIKDRVPHVSNEKELIIPQP